jgi:hypothetical protein
MDGGFFMMQYVDFEQDGHSIKGLEIIGHLRPFGEEPVEPQPWGDFLHTYLLG